VTITDCTVTAVEHCNCYFWQMQVLPAVSPPSCRPVVFTKYVQTSSFPCPLALF
jgi:hypothetical protein